MHLRIIRMNQKTNPIAGFWPESRSTNIEIPNEGNWKNKANFGKGQMDKHLCKKGLWQYIPLRSGWKQSQSRIRRSYFVSRISHGVFWRNKANFKRIGLAYLLVEKGFMQKNSSGRTHKTKPNKANFVYRRSYFVSRELKKQSQFPDNCERTLTLPNRCRAVGGRLALNRMNRIWRLPFSCPDVII